MNRSEIPIMKRTKQIAVVVVMIAIHLLSSFNAWALEYAAEPTVQFVANSPDNDGYFTVDMSIYNAKFNVFQFAIRFNKSSVMPVDSDGNQSDSFFAFSKLSNEAKGISIIGDNVDLEKGLIDFTGYISPGSTIRTDLLPALSSYANIGSSGIKIIRFHFRQTRSGNIGLKLAQKNGDMVYLEYLPNGGMLADAGERLPFRVEFHIPDSMGESHTATSPASGGLPPFSDPQSVTVSPIDVENRIKDVLALRIGTNIAVSSTKPTKIDSENAQVVPYIDSNNRTLVPLRFIAEQMGAEVTWNPETKEIVIKLGTSIVRMTIGQKEYSINGEIRVMDTVPLVREGWNRTMVPIRVIAETLGKSVEWDATNELVIVAPLDRPWLRSGQVEQEASKRFVEEIALYAN